MKYLYLERESYAEAWINGGDVPLRVASTYLGQRGGTITPDENMFHLGQGSVSADTFRKMIGPGGFARDVHFVDNYIGGKQVTSSVDLHMPQNGLILSLSNVKSKRVMQRLGKATFVEIANVQSLKQTLDEQLGSLSTARDCEYTKEVNRDYFLKSTEDQWQKEFRLLWPSISTDKIVHIPPGTGRAVEF